jgi:hypothetical protein
MHCPDAPRSARLVRHLANLDVLARSAALDTVSVPALLLTEIREAEHARQKIGGQFAIAFPRAHRMQTHNLFIRGHWTLVPRAMRAFVARLDERQELAMRVSQRDRAIASAYFVARDLRAVLCETVAPVIVTPGGNRQRDLDAESNTEPTGRRMSEREKREVGTRSAVGVGIEEMIRVRRILVHALLHQPHAEQHV